MAYVVIAIAVALIQLWRLALGPGGTDAFPALVRFLSPPILLLGFITRPRKERAAVVLVALLFFLVLNRTLIGSSSLALVLTMIVCGVLGYEGLRLTESGDQGKATSKFVWAFIFTIIGIALILALSMMV